MPLRHQVKFEINTNSKVRFDEDSWFLSNNKAGLTLKIME